MDRGVFISFEGLDGSGKSTQIEYLRSFLEAEGLNVAFVREPGSTSIGEKIREIILDKANTEMHPVTEALLYASARAQLVHEKIIPLLKCGTCVICDRFIDSSTAYQSYGRELGDTVKKINEPAIDGCMPDITFFIDVKPGEGKNRITAGRNDMDRMEREKQDFHDRVYRGYVKLAEAEPERVIVIDGMRDREAIRDEITEKVKAYINGIK